MTEEVKLYAKVIAPRTELPPLAAIYSGKIGEVIDAPDGRDASNVVWLKFANGKIGWFGYKEIELLEVTSKDAPPEYLQVPIGEIKGDITWLEIENPERNCEVRYYDG